MLLQRFGWRAARRITLDAELIEALAREQFFFDQHRQKMVAQSSDRRVVFQHTDHGHITDYARQPLRIDAVEPGHVDYCERKVLRAQNLCRRQSFVKHDWTIRED